jgi:predicted metal-dependent phosphoesterase TrpH
MIDLHTHTTASDGRCTPEALVQQARRRNVRVLSVTDHDTMAGHAAAARAAADADVTFVPGIEITSVHDGRDVHVLAYLLPATAPGLEEMLSAQRQRRIARGLEIVARLRRLGAPIDAERLLQETVSAGASIARPRIAQALVDAGHAASTTEAFDRYLADDGPAYVPHTGIPPVEVVALIKRGGGLASLAHPGLRRRDEIIPHLVDAGLDALEAFHSSHDDAAVQHYLRLAQAYGLLVTGGSDYHGEGTRRAEYFGVTQLPLEHYAALVERAGRPDLLPA